MVSQVFRIFLAVSMVLVSVYALDNGLALKPPMGWLSWDIFRCNIDCKNNPNNCINEDLYMQMADRMAADGYRDAGYQFVNIDDCWMAKQRDKNSRLQPDPDRFSHGIPYLVDYMHKKGLKLGIYADYGNFTCEGYPGSLQYLQLDAQTFADWKVDMLKMDGCNSDVDTMDQGYPLMGSYLNQTGQPIVYSCSWPAYLVFEGKEPNYKDIAKSCNLWRNYNDIQLDWTSVQSIITYYNDHQDAMAEVGGPGQWNDPDMIIIGSSQLTIDQSQTQMAIWSMWSAPLIMSNDLRNISDDFKKILLNKKVIAVDQDPLGIFGKMTLDVGDVKIYAKPMTPVNSETGDHSYAVVFFNTNLSERATTTLYAWSYLGLTAKDGYMAENLFTDEQYGIVYPDDPFTTRIKPTGVVMLKLTVVMKS